MGRVCVGEVGAIFGLATVDGAISGIPCLALGQPEF